MRYLTAAAAGHQTAEDCWRQPKATIAAAAGGGAQAPGGAPAAAGAGGARGPPCCASTTRVAVACFLQRAPLVGMRVDREKRKITFLIKLTH